jgi:hypothetical protein
MAPLIPLLIVTIVVVFVLLREFWCWYWKLNRMIELLQSIDESLKQLPAVSRNKGGVVQDANYRWPPE